MAQLNLACYSYVPIFSSESRLLFPWDFLSRAFFSDLPTSWFPLRHFLKTTREVLLNQGTQKFVFCITSLAAEPLEEMTGSQNTSRKAAQDHYYINSSFDFRYTPPSLFLPDLEVAQEDPRRKGVL